MKLLRAFVTTDSVIPVLSAIRSAGGRPVVPPLVESTISGYEEYESLLEDLASDPRGGGRVVRIRAICQDDDADRSVAAVAEAAHARSVVVLITPWNEARTADSSPRRES